MSESKWLVQCDFHRFMRRLKELAISKFAENPKAVGLTDVTGASVPLELSRWRLHDHMASHNQARHRVADKPCIATGPPL